MDNENQKDLVDQSANASGNTDTKKDSVAYETYQKTLNQERNLRERVGAYEAELQKLKEDLEDRLRNL